MSETNSLAEALAAVQGKLPKINKNKTAEIRSDRTGKSFTYKYADLAEVVEVVAPLLSEHGLSFSAKPTTRDGQFVLAYLLRHTSGEEDGGDFPLPNPRDVDIKQVGIAITYARRYVFTSVLGIVTDEDTDVHGAPEPAPARQLPPQAQRGKERAAARQGPDPDAQRRKYHKMREQLGWDEEAGHDFINDVSRGNATRWTDLDAKGRGFILDQMQAQVDQLNMVGHAFPPEDE